MTKTLDQKLSSLKSGSDARDFILADAKDADMAFGIQAPGYTRDEAGARRLRSIGEYQELIRSIVEQGLVDVMLMSPSSAEAVCRVHNPFESSAVTPAIRANDTTDIWLAGTSASYGKSPSLPFRTASLDHVLRGEGSGFNNNPLVDLGLYSITLNNDAGLDYNTLTAYRQFWLEAEAKGFRHFLEVFAPNACSNLSADEVALFVNNSIVRTLAGMSRSCRPLFLKVPYFGPAAMEELAGYDSELVIGIMGGSAGTTRDAFQMLADAKRHGARAALFGRKINNAECQLTFVHYLRAIADDQIGAEEAVRAYHGDLEKLGISPIRPLKDDLTLTDNTMAYAAS